MIQQLIEFLKNRDDENNLPETMAPELTPKKETGRASEMKPVRVFSSKGLFQGQREIIIEHCDKRYRLQITKAGKLILNK